MDIELLLSLPPHELEMRMLSLSHKGLTFKLLQECSTALMYDGLAVDHDIADEPTPDDYEELNSLFEKSEGELGC